MLALACASASAQRAERPDIRRGDEWRFVVHYAVQSTQPNRIWIVESVGDDEIRGTENGELLRLTPELNMLESPRYTDSNPQLLRFPLEVGNRWGYVTDVAFKDNRSAARVAYDVSVAAHEKVSVPAGEFDAFRIETRGAIRGHSKGGPGILEGESTASYWYAPAARAIVKAVTRNPYRGTATVELVESRRSPP